jgi:transcriptional regulator GlxA family with amidase domain
MQVAVLTFDGFNELDSFVSYLIINRLKARGWQAFITSPNEHVASMNGINIQAEKPLEFAQEADAVLVGSGTKTLDIVNDSSLMSRIKLNPDIQLIGAQCSGTLVLSRLGVLETGVACTDLKTKPWVIESGLDVLDQPFFADGNVATAGGCLASQYLAAWIIMKLGSQRDVEAALRTVAPVGQIEEYISRALSAVAPYIRSSSGVSAIADAV